MIPVLTAVLLAWLGPAGPNQGSPAQERAAEKRPAPVSESELVTHGFDEVDSDLLRSWIVKRSKGARVIGLGEVSHYTRECYLLKRTMIEALIEEGLDGLILEVDFGQALIWNDYVVHGSGDLDEIVAASGWFTYRTEEFRSLLASLRAHNLEATVPFEVFGMEMTASNSSLAWLAAYLDEHGRDAKDVLTLLRQARPSVAFQKHSAAESMEYWSLYHAATEILTASREHLVEQGGEGRYARALRIAETLRQYAAYVSQDDSLLQVELRDLFSTRNVLWCMNQLGDDSQVAIWAHNGHVTKESVLFQYDVLGHYLDQRFGEAYVAVGFTFNEGEFGAFGDSGFATFRLPRVGEASLTSLLAQESHPYLVLDVTESLRRDTSRDSLLRQPLAVRTDVAEFYRSSQAPLMELQPERCYDALVYIDKTSTPTTIPWKR